VISLSIWPYLLIPYLLNGHLKNIAENRLLWNKAQNIDNFNRLYLKFTNLAFLQATIALFKLIETVSFLAFILLIEFWDVLEKSKIHSSKNESECDYRAIFIS